MLVVLGGAMMLGWLFWRQFDRDKRLRERIEDAPKATLSTFPVDRAARVEGIARAILPPIAAPLSKRPCVYYKVWLIHHVDGNSDGRGWSETLLEDHGGVEFELDDGTERALVDPRGAELALDTDWRRETLPGMSLSPEQAAFVTSHDKTAKLARKLGKKHLRWKEAIVGVDEPITILGSATRENGRLKLAGEGLIISDGRERT